ncbi:MAG: hypothetical protein ACTSPM_09995 [Candidatus Heimdallarchaeota archaeon]
MSFGSIMLGMLIGGIVSSGAIIGVTFLGTLVPWWAVLLIGAAGCLFGGLLAGILAKGAGAGALAGLLSGILVFVGVFLFIWLYYKAQVIAMIAGASSVTDIANQFVDLFGASGTPVGDAITTWLTTNVPSVSEMEAFANSNFIFFGLIVGAIFGGLASVVNLFAGLIGGLFTRKKSDKYDSYY